MKTLPELLEEYVEHMRALGYAERTVASYRDETAIFLGWFANAERTGTPDRLTRSHLMRWQRRIAAAKNKKGGRLSPRTVNRKITSVKSFLAHLVERGFLLKGTDVLRYVKEPQLLPKGVVPHERIRRIFSGMRMSTASDHRNRAMLELLYTTGIRARELLGLDIGSLDLERAAATVMGKGSKERIVPIGKTAMRQLRTYLKVFRPMLLMDQSEQALFISPWGARLSYNSFRRIVHRHFDAGPDTSVTPHTFRRSCTTELVRGGANLYHVKEILGHATLDTLKHYVRLDITDLKKTHSICHPREKD